MDKFPFEISETGWGEFQIQIKIFFNETGIERPVILTHNLRLYESGEDLEAQIKNGCKPVLAEHYDEVVISNIDNENELLINSFCLCTYIGVRSSANWISTNIGIICSHSRS